MMRIVFMGTPDFAVPSLNQLIQDGHEIVGVYTQPDKPKNRGMKLTPPPVKVVAQANHLPVFQPKTLKDEAVQQELAALAPELIAHVKTLILTGATAQKIEDAVKADPGFAESGLVILRAADMPQAVEMARAAAQPGDIVSLSPACASFDSYPNFEARGRHYKELVNAL